MKISLGDILFGIWVLAAVAIMFGLCYETDGFCKAVERLRNEIEKEKEESK